MADAERVRRRLREMDRQLALLADLRGGGRAPFLADVSVQAQVEHPQLSFIEACGAALEGPLGRSWDPGPVNGPRLPGITAGGVVLAVLRRALRCGVAAVRSRPAGIAAVRPP